LHNIPEDIILHSQGRETLNYYIIIGDLIIGIENIVNLSRININLLYQHSYVLNESREFSHDVTVRVSVFHFRETSFILAYDPQQNSYFCKIV
jgi:hypothetical protein